MRAYFEREKPVGYDLFKEGSFRLLYGKELEEVDPKEWTYILGNDLNVEMSMVMQSATNGNGCPRCGRRGTPRNGGYKW